MNRLLGIKKYGPRRKMINFFVEGRIVMNEIED